MFCNQCGQKLKETALFCPNCGAPTPLAKAAGQSAPDASQPPETPEVPAASAPAVRQAAPPAAPQSAPASAQPRKKSGAGIAAVLFILVIAAAGVLALGYFDLLPFDLPFRQGEKQDDPVQSGSAAKDGDDDSDSKETDGASAGELADTVDAAEFVAGPQSYAGRKLGLNAAVTGLSDTDLSASVSARTEDGRRSVNVRLAFDGEDLDAFEAGDLIYIDGTFQSAGEEEYYFEDASVTVTDGRASGETRQTAGIPVFSAPEAVIDDYTPYLGTFASYGTAQELAQYGGAMLELRMEGGDIHYTLSRTQPGGGTVDLKGSAPADGAAEIAFSGTDSSGGPASGRICLLQDGKTAVESTAAGSGTLQIPYTELTPYQGGVTAEVPEHAQELHVVCSGSTATLTLRTWSEGQWVESFSASAQIGSNGISANKQEGDRCTPSGTFDILFAFGTAERSLNIPYVQIQSGDIWVCDPDSTYYNTLQKGSSANKDWDEVENLYDKFTKHRSEACIYFNFNGDGYSSGSAQSNGGSDLFIDGVGSAGNLSSGYGDIKITASDMATLLSLLDSSKNPQVVIY